MQRPGRERRARTWELEGRKTQKSLIPQNNKPTAIRRRGPGAALPCGFREEKRHQGNKSTRGEEEEEEEGISPPNPPKLTF